jgi:hypothetical protein
MLRPGPEGWASIALGVGGRDAGNDSVPARDRGIHRRSIREMKKKTFIIVGIAAVAVVVVAGYFWGPGAAPPGQPPVVTLTEANVTEFVKAFDTGTDVPRLVFLLSPT